VFDALNIVLCIAWNGYEAGRPKTQDARHQERSPGLWFKVGAELSGLDALMQEPHQQLMPGCQKGLALKDFPQSRFHRGIIRRRLVT
jgi:hypothetical protein